jgi:hypothetical protein
VITASALRCNRSHPEAGRTTRVKDSARHVTPRGSVASSGLTINKRAIQRKTTAAEDVLIQTTRPPSASPQRPAGIEQLSDFYTRPGQATTAHECRMACCRSDYMDSTTKPHFPASAQAGLQARRRR